MAARAPALRRRAQPSILAVAVVGSSGSGKTTLLERLIPELQRRGTRVGAIKHSHHDFDFDARGKDSSRLFQAGADAVLFASPSQLALVRRERPEHAIDLDTLLGHYLPDVDLVLVEGWKELPLTKIEVLMPGLAPSAPPEQLLAVVSAAATDLMTSPPHFSRDDIAGLADLLEQLLTLRSR